MRKVIFSSLLLVGCNGVFGWSQYSNVGDAMDTGEASDSVSDVEADSLGDSAADSRSDAKSDSDADVRTDADAKADSDAAPPPLLPLHVSGTKIVDSNNKTMILRGVSLPDIGALYSNATNSFSGIQAQIDAVLTTAGMKPNVLRLSVYPHVCDFCIPGTVSLGPQPYYSPLPYPVGTPSDAGPTQGTITSLDYINFVIIPTIEYAASKGLYVIIDYQQVDNITDENVGMSPAGQDAETFWGSVAPKLAPYNNVLLELFSEPIDASNSNANVASIEAGWVAWIQALSPVGYNPVFIISSKANTESPYEMAEAMSAASVEAGVDAGASGTNFAYSMHITPSLWTTATTDCENELTNTLTLAPVIVTQWGFEDTDTSTFNFYGTTSVFATPLQTYIDGDGASWTAAWADNVTIPPMFATANGGSLTDFGTFVKTWLASF